MLIDVNWFPPQSIRAKYSITLSCDDVHRKLTDQSSECFSPEAALRRKPITIQCESTLWSLSNATRTLNLRTWATTRQKLRKTPNFTTILSTSSLYPQESCFTWFLFTSFQSYRFGSIERLKVLSENFSIVVRLCANVIAYSSPFTTNHCHQKCLSNVLSLR